MITLIAAIGKHNELGFANKLLWKIPEDMHHFKTYTMGKILVMGRNTFESIGKPLPGRRCVVVSHKELLGHPVIRAETLESALSIEHCYDELVVIGGASIYEQTLEYADKLMITEIDAEAMADAYFPRIDKKIWKVNNVIEGGSKPINFKFVEYIRNESNGVPRRETS